MRILRAALASLPLTLGIAACTAYDGNEAAYGYYPDYAYGPGYYGAYWSGYYGDFGFFDDFGFFGGFHHRHRHHGHDHDHDRDRAAADQHHGAGNDLHRTMPAPSHGMVAPQRPQVSPPLRQAPMLWYPRSRTVTR